MGFESYEWHDDEVGSSVQIRLGNSWWPKTGPNACVVLTVTDYTGEQALVALRYSDAVVIANKMQEAAAELRASQLAAREKE